MFFKKKRDEEEIAKIKQALREEKDEMSEEETFDMTPSRINTRIPEPAPVQRPKTRPQTILPKELEDMDLEELEPLEEKKRIQPSMSAPLFVKVEKYSDIIDSIQEMKNFTEGIKQLFAVLYELETVRTETIKMMKNSVQRLEKSIVTMDSELLRPQGIDLGKHQTGEVEVSHIEDSLGDLQKQLAVLRRELSELR